MEDTKRSHFYSENSGNSTPPKTIEHIRTRMLRTDVHVSPLRKSLALNATQNSSLLEESNDDDERNTRRNQLEIQRRSLDTPQLKESYVKEQLLICTQLFAENKIGPNNAWKLQIIDMLKPLCQKPNADTLHMASTSIDISAKVYAIRVDDVHADSLKLANSMAKTSQQVVHPDDDNGNASDDDDENTETNKHKMKRNKHRVCGAEKSTVVNNFQANTCALSKIESVNFMSRVTTEGSATDDLFSSTLKESINAFILSDNRKLYEKLNLTGRNEASSVTFSSLPQLEENLGSIIRAFSDFKVDDWDPDEEEEQLGASTQVQPVVFDADGIPIPELDESIHNVFEDNDENDNVEDNDIRSVYEEMAPQLRGEVAKIVDFRPGMDATLSSEYSYNSIVNTRTSKVIDQIWAGPNHWKLKFLHRNTNKFSGQNTITITKEMKRSKKKADPVIDLEVEVTLDLTKKLVNKKKTPNTKNSNKITLPLLDYSCKDMMSFCKELMLKPGSCPVRQNTVNENGLDYDVCPYKYENPNDSLYCSQMQNNVGGDNDSNPDFDDNIGEEHIEKQVGDYLLDNLVDEPEMVLNTYINYAKKAKNVDMKVLKSAEWHILTTTTQNILSSKDNQNRVVPMTFSKMFADLPNALNEDEKKKLSCPLAFVALLHLCNEEFLHLTQIECNKDFHIAGPQEKH